MFQKLQESKLTYLAFGILSWFYRGLRLQELFKKRLDYVEK